MLDHFQMGPNLVRGFAPAGIGPRDLTRPGHRVYGDALGGTMYWGATLEVQTPLYFLPKDAGVKVAAFADAGSLWNYVGPTTFPATGEVLSGSLCAIPPCPVDNAMHVRSSVGVGLIWDSPFGPLRFDYSFPLTSSSPTTGSSSSGSAAARSSDRAGLACRASRPPDPPPDGSVGCFGAAIGAAS